MPSGKAAKVQFHFRPRRARVLVRRRKPRSIAGNAMSKSLKLSLVASIALACTSLDAGAFPSLPSPASVQQMTLVQFNGQNNRFQQQQRRPQAQPVAPVGRPGPAGLPRHHGVAAAEAPWERRLRSAPRLRSSAASSHHRTGPNRFIASRRATDVPAIRSLRNIRWRRSIITDRRRARPKGTTGAPGAIAVSTRAAAPIWARTGCGISAADPSVPTLPGARESA